MLVLCTRCTLYKKNKAGKEQSKIKKKKNGCVNWMNKWMNRWIRCKDGWKDEWMNELTEWNELIIKLVSNEKMNRWIGE